MMQIHGYFEMEVPFMVPMWEEIHPAAANVASHPNLG